MPSRAPMLSFTTNVTARLCYTGQNGVSSSPIPTLGTSAPTEPSLDEVVQLSQPLPSLPHRRISAPGAPRITTVPLPASPGNTSSSPEPELFPLSLLAPLTQVTMDQLRAIFLITPIHLHVLIDQVIHLGTFNGEYPGETYSALDLFTALHSLTTQSMDLHLTFTCLPQDIRDKVRTAFLSRNHRHAGAVNIWEQFAFGQRLLGGPTGHDLLMGKNDIWGFEDSAFDGHSIVHLA
ncbi:hypothetical protein NP233_g911 [Leucocoprinus birnbaumii]|uniref:Uncharacterized protein n=1 Tax=Leucocoprinus birnbaumii TaxID=56174 RepID=A0AAD5W1C9_9AGAR|nr:hypothetical protein NP233_g911 [Leucocoprinus birnbaumii]